VIGPIFGDQKSGRKRREIGPHRGDPASRHRGIKADKDRLPATSQKPPARVNERQSRANWQRRDAESGKTALIGHGPAERRRGTAERQLWFRLNRPKKARERRQRPAERPTGGFRNRSLNNRPRHRSERMREIAPRPIRATSSACIISALCLAFPSWRYADACAISQQLFAAAAGAPFGKTWLPRHRQEQPSVKRTITACQRARSRAVSGLPRNRSGVIPARSASESRTQAGYFGGITPAALRLERRQRPGNRTAAAF